MAAPIGMAINFKEVQKTGATVAWMQSMDNGKTWQRIVVTATPDKAEHFVNGKLVRTLSVKRYEVQNRGKV